MTLNEQPVSLHSFVIFAHRIEIIMLHVGVFGVGHLGKYHLNNWKEIRDAKVIGFYDPDDKTSKEVSEKYGLKSQLRRAAVSIPSNIAEGYMRQHAGEYIQFLHIALADGKSVV